MPKTATRTRSIYGVHPGVLMTQKWIADLKQKTGRTLDEWMKFVKKEGPTTEQARRDWLKQQHGLGTNAARWLAERSVGKGAEVSDPDAYVRAAEKYVDEMFAGKKEHLRPIYGALLKLGLERVVPVEPVWSDIRSEPTVLRIRHADKPLRNRRSIYGNQAGRSRDRVIDVVPELQP